MAIGTDSLASVEDLNMFSEMAEVRRLAPGVPAGSILKSATLDGAVGARFWQGTGLDIAGQARRAPRRARPGRYVEDVEEYLVGGIAPADIDVAGRRLTATLLNRNANREP